MMEWAKAIGETQFAAAYVTLFKLGRGTMNFYAGDRPRSADEPITNQPLLATLTFSVSGITLKPVDDLVLVSKSGECSFVRMITAEGVAICDADVGKPGWGAEVELNTTALRAGGPLRIGEITFTGKD